MLVQISSSKFIAVTPSDTVTLVWNNIEFATEYITVGVTGDVAVKDEVGTTVVLAGLVAGEVYPVETNLILATGTTATGITAYF